MQNLIQDYKRLLDDLGEVYQRNIYKKLDSDHRVVGIVGARGVGKTTYILDYLKKNYYDSSQALYVSADDIYFSNNNLVDLVERFVRENDGKILCIDEIHKYPNWSRELKNIYDKYRKLKIIFSGSSSINLVKEKYDLSRRAVLRHLPGLSFREYLEMKEKGKFPLLDLDEIVKGKTELESLLSKIPGFFKLFKQYLKTGYYPFFREYSKDEDMYDSLEGVIDKIIYMDIASYYSLKTSTLNVFKKILYFIYTSAPSSVNINKIAKNLGKDHSDTAKYLEIMRESGLLRFLLINKSGHALLRNTEKIYINNTNLMKALENATGKEIKTGSMRELFVISSLEDASMKPFYSKVGDLSCNNYIFEVEGLNKDFSQLKGKANSYLVCDDILYREPRKIPMYLFGFLY